MEIIPMKLKRSMRARGPMIFYVFLIQILFAPYVLTAFADDMNASAEDIGSESKKTIEEIISAGDGCAAPVAAKFSGGFDPHGRDSMKRGITAGVGVLLALWSSYAGAAPTAAYIRGASAPWG